MPHIDLWAYRDPRHSDEVEFLQALLADVVITLAGYTPPRALTPERLQQANACLERIGRCEQEVKIRWEAERAI